MGGLFGEQGQQDELQIGGAEAAAAGHAVAAHEAPAEAATAAPEAAASAVANGVEDGVGEAGAALFINHVLRYVL